MALGEPQADGVDDTDEDIAEFDFFKGENRIFTVGLVFDADLDDTQLLADIDRGDQARFGDEFGFHLFSVTLGHGDAQLAWEAGLDFALGPLPDAQRGDFLILGEYGNGVVGDEAPVEQLLRFVGPRVVGSRAEHDGEQAALVAQGRGY